MERYKSPTFTIRNQRIGLNYTRESELEKTIEAEQIGAITAAYQLHAYMDVDRGPAGAVVSWGIAKRVALFQWVKDHPGQCGMSSTQDEGRGQKQTFIYVPFAALPSSILVRAYPAPKRIQSYDELHTIAEQKPL